MTSFILGDAELEDVVKIIDASQNDIVNDITETYTTVTEHIGQEDCSYRWANGYPAISAHRIRRE